MTDDIQNAENDTEDEHELKPVKSPLKRILCIGTTLVVGGTVLVFVAPQLFVTRSMGVTRSARLAYERQQAEAETIINEQVNQDIQAAPNEESTD